MPSLRAIQTMPATIACGRTGVDAAHQVHVDLDEVGLEFGEQVQPGIAGAEIVDRGQEALAAVLGDDALDVADVLDLLALGELEHDVVAREAGRLGGGERRAQAGGRLVDGVRQEIDRELDVLAAREQPRCQFDRLDAAGLVEAVAVRVVDPDRICQAPSPAVPRTSAS